MYVQLGNHDQWRVGTRFESDLIDAANIISLTLPGVSVTYQGEEIGMLNNFDITWEESVDPRGCSCGPDTFLTEKCSRDPVRTPFQWNADKNAGFSNGDKTWLPVHTNYLLLNAEIQVGNPSSHLEIFKALITLRKRLHHVGTFKVHVDGNVLAFGTESTGDLMFVTVVNFGHEAAAVDLYGIFHFVYDMGLVLVAAPGGNNPLMYTFKYSVYDYLYIN
jgi:alpha-glucosidase